MKKIVSVSIGSSSRDKSVEIEILGEKYSIERIGTDGSIEKAIEIISSLDGKIDCFGMGGIDLYLSSGSSKRYIIKEAIPIIKAAKITPIADGIGVKNTLEKRVVKYLKDNKLMELENKKVLITCAIDRYKMAEGFIECGSNIIIGDLIFALGIPLPIRKLSTLRRIARVMMPLISKLPFDMLYPTGESQKEINSYKFGRYYEEADIIAGDYHYIKKYMPQSIRGKVIVTNTVTVDDVDMIKARGASMLVTTTPVWDGRSFGTNVIEAILISASGKRPEDLYEKDYFEILDRLDFKPRIEIFDGAR